MRMKALLCLATVALLAGCSTTNQLSGTGQQVRIVDTKPDAQCQFLGEITGSQSNWLSSSETSSSRDGATNDLRNKAAAMGGNVIYGATGVGETFWSGFAPLDTKVSGQVYKCAN